MLHVVIKAIHIVTKVSSQDSRISLVRVSGKWQIEANLKTIYQTLLYNHAMITYLINAVTEFLQAIVDRGNVLLNFLCSLDILQQ